MEILPHNLREVLHDIVNVIGKMLNSSEKVLEEAKAKIEQVFIHPVAEPVVAEPVVSEPVNLQAPEPAAMENKNV